MKEDGGWSGGNDVEGALVVRRMTHSRRLSIFLYLREVKFQPNI